MFTGIVEVLGQVRALRPVGDGMRLTVAVPGEAGWQLTVGESVAVSGVCLTVVAAEPGTLMFDLAEETRRVTTLDDLEAGDSVNLERPLRLDARLGGHLVLGHVDGVGRVISVRAEGEGRRLSVMLPAALRPLLIPKGSVAVDGVSLTVAELGAEAFEVALIPYTLAVTTLGSRSPGERVNLEMDVIGKYVRALMPPGGAGLPAAVGDSGAEGAR
jgi:riboflavin synthase alpha subunit